MRAFILCLLAISLTTEAYAAKKDFKGLFGSYRREKFTENEANSNEFGMDLMLSTLLPVTALVKSSETRPGTTYENLSYSTFFNVEIGAHYSLGYNWQVYALIGYYNYETRKENSVDPTQPLFHHFETTMYPIIGGIRYRFTTDDIVPYISVGGGFSYTRRRGYYDASPNVAIQDYSNALTFHVAGGVEFYFAPRLGIRLETSAFYVKLQQRDFDPGATPTLSPLLQLQGATWAVRYASGLFFLF